MEDRPVGEGAASAGLGVAAAEGGDMLGGARIRARAAGFATGPQGSRARRDVAAAASHPPGSDDDSGLGDHGVDSALHAAACRACRFESELERRRLVRRLAEAGQGPAEGEDCAEGLQGECQEGLEECAAALRATLAEASDGGGAEDAPTWHQLVELWQRLQRDVRGQGDDASAAGTARGVAAGAGHCGEATGDTSGPASRPRGAPSAEVGAEELQSWLVDAARRAARFNEELELQKAKLHRRRGPGPSPAPGLDIGATLESWRAFQELAQEHAEGETECRSALQVVERRSPEAKAEAEAEAEAWQQLLSFWRARQPALASIGDEVRADGRRAGPLIERLLAAEETPLGLQSTRRDGAQVDAGQRDGESKQRRVTRASAGSAPGGVADALERRGAEALASAPGQLSREGAPRAGWMDLASLGGAAGDRAAVQRLALEHASRLQEEAAAIEGAVRTDAEAAEAIDAWRQLASLEELRHAAQSMGRCIQGPTEADAETARAQCEEVVSRLDAQRSQEDKAQRRRLRAGRRRGAGSGGQTMLDPELLDFAEARRVLDEVLGGLAGSLAASDANGAAGAEEDREPEEA